MGGWGRCARACGLGVVRWGGGVSSSLSLRLYRAALLLLLMVVMMMMMTASTSDLAVSVHEGKQEWRERRRLSPRDSPNNLSDVRAGGV